MSDKHPKVHWEHVPDLAKIEEHGISINAATPKVLSIPNPWAPSGNGGSAQADVEPTPGPPTD